MPNTLFVEVSPGPFCRSFRHARRRDLELTQQLTMSNEKKRPIDEEFKESSVRKLRKVSKFHRLTETSKVLFFRAFRSTIQSISNHCIKPLFVAGSVGMGKTKFLDDILSYHYQQLGQGLQTCKESSYVWTCCSVLRIDFGGSTKYEIEEGKSPEELILSRVSYALSSRSCSETFRNYRNSESFNQDKSLGLNEMLKNFKLSEGMEKISLLIDDIHVLWQDEETFTMMMDYLIALQEKNSHEICVIGTSLLMFVLSPYSPKDLIEVFELPHFPAEVIRSVFPCYIRRQLLRVNSLLFNRMNISDQSEAMDLIMNYFVSFTGGNPRAVGSLLDCRSSRSMDLYDLQESTVKSYKSSLYSSVNRPKFNLLTILLVLYGKPVLLDTVIDGIPVNQLIANHGLRVEQTDENEETIYYPYLPTIDLLLVELFCTKDPPIKEHKETFVDSEVSPKGRYPGWEPIEKESKEIIFSEEGIWRGRRKPIEKRIDDPDRSDDENSSVYIPNTYEFQIKTPNLVVSFRYLKKLAKYITIRKYPLGHLLCEQILRGIRTELKLSFPQFNLPNYQQMTFQQLYGDSNLSCPFINEKILNEWTFNFLSPMKMYCKEKQITPWNFCDRNFIDQFRYSGKRPDPGVCIDDLPSPIDCENNREKYENCYYLMKPWISGFETIMFLKSHEGHWIALCDQERYFTLTHQTNLEEIEKDLTKSWNFTITALQKRGWDVDHILLLFKTNQQSLDWKGSLSSEKNILVLAKETLIQYYGKALNDLLNYSAMLGTQIK